MPLFFDMVPERDAVLTQNWRVTTVQFNLSGHPAVCLNVTRADGSCGASVQLVGANGKDEQLLNIAAELFEK